MLKECSLKLSVFCLVLCCCLHRFVAISYDVKQKKPELSIAWSGDTLSEKVSQWLQVVGWSATMSRVGRRPQVRLAQAGSSASTLLWAGAGFRQQHSGWRLPWAAARAMSTLPVLNLLTECGVGFFSTSKKDQLGAGLQTVDQGHSVQAGVCCDPPSVCASAASCRRPWQSRLTRLTVPCVCGRAWCSRGRSGGRTYTMRTPSGLSWCRCVVQALGIKAAQLLSCRRGPKHIS